MKRVRQQLIPLIRVILAAGAIHLAGATLAFTQERDSLQDFERCQAIPSDQARLDCLKKLLPNDAPADSAVAIWRLIRTPRPNGGPDAVAIMRTADTTQSDPDLGLMIRCQEKAGLEVVLALLRPFPPRSKKEVVVTLGSTESILHAETSAPGTALVLPIDATIFTTGPWRELKQLSVTIRDPGSDVRGVIPLDGIVPALAKLSASCPSG
jgi:hypothetical protein